MDKKNTETTEYGHNKPNAVGQVLNKTGLHNLVIKAKKIKELDDFIKNSIAPEWASYYHVQNLNGNTLIIGCSNSSAAQKIRLNSMDWLYNLRQAHWPELAKIEIKVAMEDELQSRFQQQKLKRATDSVTKQKMVTIASTMPAELQKAWLDLADLL
jgi:hypothetical protein